MLVLAALGSTAAATDPGQSDVWLAPTITVAVALLGIVGAYVTNRAMATGPSIVRQASSGPRTTPPTDVDAAAWRLWMETLFIPTRRRIRDHG
ncbi:hypothetical protein D9M72_479660 [compost metagenome]